MKKYLVLKFYENPECCSSIVFSTDSFNDATNYAAIMRRNKEKDGYDWIVLTQAYAEV